MEPLIPLARAVATEIDRLHIRAAVHVDVEHHAVIVEGVPEADVPVLVVGFARARVKTEAVGNGCLIVYPS